MGIFQGHEPCPKCGSKDNLARYDDGSAWCFGCGYKEYPTHYTPKDRKISSERTLALPEDASEQIGKQGVEWLGKYDIKQKEIIRYRMLWSTAQQQLIFPIFDGNGRLLAWQARNFSDDAKGKYFSQGKIHDLIYTCGTKSPNIVLVEDLVSAIKVGRIGYALPLFGSEASTPLLMRLKTIADGIIVWLDSDKWKNAHDIVNRARSVGLNAMCVFTNLDPKEFDDEQIRFFLMN